MPPKANLTPRKTVAKRAVEESIAAPPAKRAATSTAGTPVPISVAGPSSQVKIKKEEDDEKPEILSTSGNVLLKLKDAEPVVKKEKGSEKRKFNRNDFAFQKLQIITGSGSDKFIYYVSPTLLLRNAKWFKDHFWKTQVLLLPDVDSDIFGIWVAWLHTGDIRDAEENIIVDTCLSAVELSEVAPRKTKQLVELYALGMRFECEGFGNYMVSQIIGHIKFLFQRLGPKSQFGLEGHMIYNLTAKDPVTCSTPVASSSTTVAPVFKDNKLTLALKDFFFGTACMAPNLSNSLCGDCRERRCPVAMRFFVDLAIMGMECARTRRKVELPWERSQCYYHEHDEECREKCMIRIE